MISQKINFLLKIPRKLWRYPIIPRLKSIIGYPNNEFKNSPIQKEFIEKLRRYKSVKKNNSSYILCQGVEDHAVSIKLAAASSAISQKYKANIAFYTVASKLEDSRYWGEGMIRNYFSEKMYKAFDDVYLAFGEKVLFRNVHSYRDKNKVDEVFNTIKKTILTKYDVINITIEDIKIGDLIYDTYLRFRSKPTVDIEDSYLDKVIIESINIFYNVKDLIATGKIKALVNSYTTYIHHGIIVRLFQKNKIPVYTVVAYYSLIHKSIPQYPSFSNNYFLFPKTFNLLDNKAERLMSVKEQFERRFSGAIDAATVYMKESAFSNTENETLKNIEWNNTVVVLAHCFFDSPHIYRDLIFPDFYEWIIFTLDELSKNEKATILVKPHPNGFNGNDEIFEGLQEKYKNTNIIFIDKKTSQLQIINSKPKTIITAYGTAAAEFAYQGFPVLTIYDNPFSSYNFTHMAKTIQEYKLLLQNVLNLPSKQNKEQILEYYYMQHVFYLQGRDFDFLNFMKYKGDTFNDVFLKDYLPLMNEEYFKKLDDGIIDGLNLIEWEEKQELY